MSRPTLLHYYITNRCNAKCSFCEIWCENEKVDAVLADVKLNLADARRAGCRFVDFTGGEPLLHANLPEMLREAKRLGFVTSVTTNCILFCKRVHELAGLIDLLHFSLDADNAELHDHIRGVKSFDAVVASIEPALAAGLRPDLLFTYTDENIGSFEGVMTLAEKYGLVAILDPVFQTDGSMDNIRPETHEKARKFSKHRSVYLNTAHLTLRENGGNNFTKPLCRAVSAAVVILPDNSLALPCYHHKSTVLKLNGNLLDALRGSVRKSAEKRQGREMFCAGCHINCYFDPSFTDRFVHPYFEHSLMAKMKYAWRKYVACRIPRVAR